ncbi:MAG: HAD family acid phosphatase [Marmoricola sp.]
MRLSRLIALFFVIALVAPVSPVSPVSAASASTALPTKQQWLADVSKAMYGSRAYLGDRLAAAKPGERLAINLDVDNTALATRYSPGEAIVVVRRFTRYAHNHGIAVFFNTGRGPKAAADARTQLLHAGYTVDRFCHRRTGERLIHGKERCRASFVKAGYTIVANVGNRSTDFVGGNYERAFMLPNYGNRLG